MHDPRSKYKHTVIILGMQHYFFSRHWQFRQPKLGVITCIVKFTIC